MTRAFVDLRVFDDLLDRLHDDAEEVFAELLEADTGHRRVRVDALGGEVLQDEVAGEQVSKADLVQAESSARIRDSLQDVVRSRNRVLERVVQRIGNLGLL